MKQVNGGYTLLEMMAGLALLGILMTAVFTTTMRVTGTYALDKSRLSTLRNLRAGFDLLNADVREAGENLPSAAPAVRVYMSADKPPVATLKLLRGLSDTYLPLCGSANTNTSLLYVNSVNNPNGGTVSGVNKLPDACSNLVSAAQPWEAVRQARIAAGGTSSIRAVMVDVKGKTINTFAFKGLDGNGDLIISDLKLDTPINTARTKASDPTGDTRLYLVEERTYWRQGDAIYLDIDGQGGQIAIPRAINLEFTPVIRTVSGSADAALPFGNVGADPDWRDLGGVRISATVKDGNQSRSATESLLPRNALSRDQ